MTIGAVGCTFYADLNQVGITYFIGAADRRHGYAVEAARAYTAYFLSHYNNLDLIATVRVANVGSCKMVENAGFVLTEQKLYCDVNDTEEQLYNFHVVKRS